MTPSKYLTEQEHYVQLVNQMTTDHKTQIGHIYTNIIYSPKIIYCSCVLELQHYYLTGNIQYLPWYRVYHGMINFN